MNSLQVGQWAGRVALVTGAGSGIGAAVARKLAGLGVERVILADLDRHAAERVAGALADARVGELDVAESQGDRWRVMERAGHTPVNVQVVELDVADEAQVDRLVAEIDRDHGLDVVVHAAGVDDPAAKQRIADAMAAGRPPEVTAWLESPTWRRVMSVNLDGTFHVLRAAVRRMVPKRAGVIVVVGSSSAFDAPAGYPHYSASKAGVHALAQAVAKEVIPFGVRVNVVAPGPTDTGMAARTPDLLRQAFTGPGARPYATPEEIADVAVFLAGRESANLAGAVLLANGGRFTV